MATIYVDEYKDIHALGNVIDSLPVGSVVIWPSSTIPSGWILCNGDAISRTRYNDLFKVIGTTFGPGDGSTTFNAPDFRGRVPVGLDVNDTDFDTLGETGGEKTHTLTINEMPSHNHQSYAYFEGSGGTPGVWAVRSYAGLAGYKDTSSQTGGGQSHNILQPYITLNYIIKAFFSVSASGGGGGDDPNAYSGIETCVGTWDDNGTEIPLYRKIITFPALPNNTTSSTNHNVSNLKEFTLIEGFARSSQNKGGIPLPHATSSPVTYWVDDTRVYIMSTSDRTAYTKAYIYLYYTKNN